MLQFLQANIHKTLESRGDGSGRTWREQPPFLPMIWEPTAQFLELTEAGAAATAAASQAWCVHAQGPQRLKPKARRGCSVTRDA